MIEIFKLDKNGFDMTAFHEGCKLKPYPDSKCIPTIGIGTTIYPNGKLVSLTDLEITLSQAYEFFNYYLEKNIYPWFEKNLKWQPTQNEFNALIDFLYNTGVGKKFNSYVHTKEAIINGNKDIIIAGMLSIDSILLHKRRQNEVSMFKNGTWIKW